MADRLGIIDIRNIIRTINETYNIDLTDFALTSFKRRLERMILKHNLTNSDDLIAKLIKEQDFINYFIKDVIIDDTEMFRDPSLWRFLKEELFLSLISPGREFTIWFPECSSGEELLSIAIILEEASLSEHVKIIATSISLKNIEFAREAVYDLKKMETNIANYRRLKGNLDLSNYYNMNNNKVHFDSSLVENIEFRQLNILKDELPAKTDMVFFRNRLIYFNLPLQNKMLDILYSQLKPGGLLIIGIKETIDAFNSDNRLVLVNSAENIFKKVIY